MLLPWLLVNFNFSSVPKPTSIHWLSPYDPWSYANRWRIKVPVRGETGADVRWLLSGGHWERWHKDDPAIAGELWSSSHSVHVGSTPSGLRGVTSFYPGRYCAYHSLFYPSRMQAQNKAIIFFYIISSMLTIMFRPTHPPSTLVQRYFYYSIGLNQR